MKEQIETIVEGIAFRAFNGIYQDNGLSLPSKTRTTVAKHIGTEAADALQALIAPNGAARRWQYPSKGELPEENRQLWVAIGDVTYAAIGSYQFGYFLVNGFRFLPSEVRCFTPVIIPQPPQEAAGE